MERYIGLDLGGTALKYAVGDKNGNIIIKKSRPSLAKESQEIIFQNIIEAVNELKNECDSEIKGIGIGTPGSIDFEKGQLIGMTPNIPAWTDAPIKKTLEAKLNIPVWVDNDANVMALAEARCGAGKGYSYILCLTLGTGIGGGIILNDKVYRGANYSAAEVGHITVETDGKMCNCGTPGCLEAYSSAPAMVESYKEKLIRSNIEVNGELITTKTLFEKASKGNKFAQQTINETSNYLGTGIASIVNVLNPQIVIIGGGVADAGQEFLSSIENVVRKKAMKAKRDCLRVVKAKLGNDAGMVGAMILASEN